MTIATLSKQVGWELPEQGLPEAFGPGLLPSVAATSASLVKRIQNETATVDQIDSFLQKNRAVLPDFAKQDILAALYSKKAWLLFQQGQQQEGLKQYDQALRIKETPSTWASKGMALLEVERLDDAFDAFRKSYSLRENFGPQEQAHLENLIGAWSVAALLRGLSGILEQDVREAEKGVFEYIKLLDKAKQDNFAHMVLNLAVELPVPEDIQAGLEELSLMVRLLSITDPFEGWRALTMGISKVWPKGLSAVDAIREQRDRQWNT